MKAFGGMLKGNRVGNNLAGVNSAMPFMKKTADGGVECYWNVHATGDWSADVQMGRAFAKALLTVVRAHDRAPLVSRVLSAMPLQNPTGIEIGFVQFYTEAAMLGLDKAAAREGARDAKLREI